MASLITLGGQALSRKESAVSTRVRALYQDTSGERSMDQGSCQVVVRTKLIMADLGSLGGHRDKTKCCQEESDRLRHKEESENHGIVSRGGKWNVGKWFQERFEDLWNPQVSKTDISSFVEGWTVKRRQWAWKLERSKYFWNQDVWYIPKVVVKSEKLYSF